MKKLENKIVKKVYVMETKRTLLEIVIRSAFIILLAVFSIFLVADIINILVEQQTLDMFQLFQENQEVIRRYFGEVMSTFYIEAPKLEIGFTIVLMLVVVALILLFMKNFGKIKNKIHAIGKFWMSR